MISENFVDITGFAKNIMVKHNQKFTNIYFTLNVPNRYKKNGEYITEYEVLSCVISDSKNEYGRYSNSFEKLNKDLVENHLLRVQGSISSWFEGIKDNQLIPVNEENREEFARIIPRTIIKIKDYKLLENREKALIRTKRSQKLSTETGNTVEKEVREDEGKYEEEQLEMKMTYFPEFEVPQYKNMPI